MFASHYRQAFLFAAGSGTENVTHEALHTDRLAVSLSSYRNVSHLKNSYLYWLYPRALTNSARVPISNLFHETSLLLKNFYRAVFSKSWPPTLTHKETSRDCSLKLYRDAHFALLEAKKHVWLPESYPFFKSRHLLRILRMAVFEVALVAKPAGDPWRQTVKVQSARSPEVNAVN